MRDIIRRRAGKETPIFVRIRKISKEEYLQIVGNCKEYIDCVQDEFGLDSGALCPINCVFLSER